MSTPLTASDRALVLLRRIALRAAVPVVTFLVAAFALPGQAGSRGTPMAILFMGVVNGFVTALLAAGLVLIYRTQRIINFSQTALGFAGAFACFSLVRYTATPFPIALIIGLVLGGAGGLIFDLFFGRRFFRAPRLLLTVVTIAAAPFLTGAVSDPVRRLGIFPAEGSVQRQRLDLIPFERRLPFPGFHFFVGSLQIRFQTSHLFAIEMGLLGLLAVGIFVRYTRVGVGTRAVAENAERTSLLGVSTGTLSSVVWTVAGVLSAAGLVAYGLLNSPESVTGITPNVLLPAIAAAVLGQMRSIPLTAIAAVTISAASSAILWSYPGRQSIVDIAIFVALAIGLLLGRKTISRADVASSGSWAVSEEQRPIPHELAGLAPVRYSRWAMTGAVGIALILVPFLAPVRITSLGSVMLIHGIIALSLVVLTGWGGQVSLAQFAFAAVGSVVGGAMTHSAGIPFWFALPLAAAVVAGVAFLIGLPALRVRGLFLLAVSFAFALAVRSSLFDHHLFGWLLPDRVDRPTLFVISFEDERAMFFLCVAALGAALALVVNVRRSRLGRLLIAVRDNEADAQAQGIDTARLKLLAFAFSGALAGFAGCLLAHQQRAVSPDSFAATASISLFLYVILGGVGSPAGALLGTLIQGATTYLITSPLVQSVLGPGLTLYILYASPAGLVSALTRVRDGALRILAQRRQLIVPALYAGADRRALAAQLIPLAPPSTRGGLADVPEARTMILESLTVAAVGGLADGEEARLEEAAALTGAAAAIENTTGSLL